jgi:ubiquinone/menaquinone biosynthesis C-methylase UbiE
MNFPGVSLSAVRDYWDKRPCNIRHSPKPVGSKEYFQEVRARKYFVEPHIPAFAEYGRWQGKKVLEIGCGIGTDTSRFAEAGANVTAVDLSPASLEVAKQAVQAWGVAERVTFYQANAEELQATLPVESYDLIYSFGVLHHTPHPEAAFAQLRNYAKPGTELRIMMYYRWSWKVFWILAQEGFRFWDADKLIAKHSEAQTGCPVTYSYSHASLKKLVEAHGFKVMDQEVHHIFPWRIPDYVQYRYVKEWYWAWMPQPLFHVLERLFGWHLCMKAVAV